MKENVGKTDQLVRSLVGPGLITFGYAGLGGNKGRLSGLVAIVVGTLITESAITKVCPVNALLGVDTTKNRFSKTEKVLA